MNSPTPLDIKKEGTRTDSPSSESKSNAEIHDRTGLFLAIFASVLAGMALMAGILSFVLGNFTRSDLKQDIVSSEMRVIEDNKKKEQECKLLDTHVKALQAKIDAEEKANVGRR